MATKPTIAHKHSPYVSHLLAGADLRNKEGYAVKLSSGAWVLCDTQGELGFPLIAGANTGEPVTVAMSAGVQCPVIVDDVVAVGGYLTPAVTSGKFEPAGSADISTVIALEASTADGDYIMAITIGPETVA